MIYSHELQLITEANFLCLKVNLGEKFFEELSKQVEGRGELSFILKWIYGNSPYEDVSIYPFSLFENAAKHALYLSERSPYAAGLSAEDFLSYVAHPRVNDEELCDCREFFYSKLKDRVAGLGAEEAVLEVNRFCAENVSYKSSDLRTRSALSAFHFATGRCGEESTFLVNALRAVGIPARQVYVPRWAHCDDNHAWVEAYVGGDWHFLGACEIDEILDCGWFNEATTRAPLIYARRFGKPSEGEDVLFTECHMRYINVLSRYALSKKLSITVLNKDGTPAANACVEMCILNYARFIPVAKLTTNVRGKCFPYYGIGCLFLRARTGEGVGEAFVNTMFDPSVTVCIGQYFQEKTFSYLCPAGRGRTQKTPSSEQRQRAKEERARACERRKNKDKEAQDLFARIQKLRPLSMEDKEALKIALSEKDLQDAKVEVLEEAYAYSKQYQCDFPREIYLKYLFSPRVENEPLFKNREEILAALSSQQRELFKKDPAKLMAFVDGKRTIDEKITQFFFSPKFAIEQDEIRLCKRAKNVLFVQIARALGIPARLSPSDFSPQYYWEGEFKDARGRRDCTLFLRFAGEGEMSLSTMNGGEICLPQMTEGEFLLSLPEGSYRLIAQNRLPSGSISAAQVIFSLSPQKTKRITLESPELKLSDFLLSIPLEGTCAEGKSGVLAFLEPKAEPSEHFLAECNDLLQTLPITYFFPADCKDPAPHGIPFDEEEEEIIARRVLAEPGRLPLLILAKEGVCRLRIFGYRVGSAELIQKVYNLLFDENRNKE